MGDYSNAAFLERASRNKRKFEKRQIKRKDYETELEELLNNRIYLNKQPKGKKAMLKQFREKRLNKTLDQF